MGKISQGTECAGFLLDTDLLHFTLNVLEAFSFVYTDVFKIPFQIHIQYGFTAKSKMICSHGK